MSGKAAAWLGDMGLDHDCHYPETPAIEASEDVLINGKGAVRVGDAFEAHGCPVCPEDVHDRKLAQGSPTVLINGRTAGRVGDVIDCGGTVIIGSPDVLLDSSASSE